MTILPIVLETWLSKIHAGGCFAQTTQRNALRNRLPRVKYIDMDSSSGLGPLPEGGRVVIIGGGPGGTACALHLSQQAEQLGRSVQITLVEGKQFSGEQHYNQCGGVLEAPVPGLL